MPDFNFNRRSTGWENCAFRPDQRVRIADAFPNIRWAGMYGRIEAFDVQHGDRYYILLEDGGHHVWAESRYIADAPTAEQLERREQARAIERERAERLAAAQTDVATDEWADFVPRMGGQYRVQNNFTGTGFDEGMHPFRLASLAGIVVRVGGPGDHNREVFMRFPATGGDITGWVPYEYLVVPPDLPTFTGTVTGRFTSGVSLDTKYVQKMGDVLILGDNGQPLGCVDAQVPLGECRVKVMINGEARWYRMVEAVSREAEAEAAKVGVFTPGRKLNI